MAAYDNLRAVIAANVYQNNNNEVTADMVKAAMNAMVASLGAEFQFGGVAKLTPTQTDPGTPDYKVAYIASEPGTYSNFGGLVVENGEVAIIKGSGTTWSKEILMSVASASALAGKVDILPGENLLDVNSPNCIPSKFIDSSGAVASGNVNYKVSDFIPITPNENYYLSNADGGYIGLSGYVAFYDSEKNLVGTPVNTQAITTPSGASFLRCTINAGYSERAMLNAGTQRGTYYAYNPIGGYLSELNSLVASLSASVSALDVLPGRIDALRKNEDIKTWISSQVINVNQMQIAANLRTGIATIVENAKGVSFDFIKLPFVADDASRDYTLIIGQSDGLFDQPYKIVNDALTTPGNILLTQTVKLGTILGYTDISLNSEISATRKYVAVGVITASGSHVKVPYWSDSTGKTESTFFSTDNGASWSAYSGSAAGQKYGAFPILLLANEVKKETGKLQGQINVIQRDFPGYIERADSVQSGGEISIADFPHYAKTRDRVAFLANISSFSTLRVGRGYGANYGVWLEIDSANVKIIRRTNNANAELSSQAHGLTFSTFIKVLFSFDESGELTYIVQTLSGYFKYTYTPGLYGGMGAAFAVPDGMALSNCSLAAYNSGAKLDVWVFGDSYVAVNNTRWPFYLFEWGYEGFAVYGLSGGGSASLFNEFVRAANYGNPNFALWSLGMNDGSDADINTPSAVWLSNVQSFIADCEERGITPILATIPSVPSIYHEGKNKWIRESGHRYVDFAAAVGAQADGTWYAGMLSSDNIHPSQIGGQALATQVLVDFPEIMNK